MGIIFCIVKVIWYNFPSLDINNLLSLASKLEDVKELYNLLM